MLTEEKTKEINDKYSKCVYYEYELNIADETETSFILNNGDGEGVSNNSDINTQFMMINETLGFERVDKATYQKTISKFDNNIMLKALKLITYKTWLLRVIKEKDEKYLVFVNKVMNEEGWEKGENFSLKWLNKTSVTEIEPFISYWKK